MATELVRPKPGQGIVETVAPSSGGSFLVKVKDTSIQVAKDVLPSPYIGIACGLAGALAWKQHRFLGFLAGMIIGANAPALISAETRKLAIRNMAVGACGIGAALLWKKRPVTGLAVGLAAGTAAVAVAGSYVGLPPWIK